MLIMAAVVEWEALAHLWMISIGNDSCYSDAMQHPECWPILDNPYTEFYAYNCDNQNKKITCGSEYPEKLIEILLRSSAC